MIALGTSELLDHKLTELFNNLEGTIVGFNFAADMSAFTKSFPTMNFYKKFPKLFDACETFQNLFPESTKCNLPIVVEKLFN